MPFHYRCPLPFQDASFHLHSLKIHLEFCPFPLPELPSILADCSIGFAQGTLGGKGDRIYIITDSSDHDPVNPKLSTLRHAVIPKRTPLDNFYNQHGHQTRT